MVALCVRDRPPEPAIVPPGPMRVRADVFASREAAELRTKPDSRLQDPAALAEIELFGEVVVAAASIDHPLSADELDEVLGLAED